MQEQINIAMKDIDNQVAILEGQKETLRKLFDDSISNISKWKVICDLPVKNKDEIAIKFLMKAIPGGDRYSYTAETSNIYFEKFVVKILNYKPYKIDIEYMGVARGKYPELIPASNFESVFSKLFEAAEKGVSTDSMAKYLFPKSGYIVRNIRFFFVKRKFGELKKECEKMKEARYQASNRLMSEYNNFQNDLGKFDACYYDGIRSFANREVEINRVKTI